MRKRMLKVRVDEQQATLLKLNNAVSELSKELGDERDKPYIVSTKRHSLDKENLLQLEHLITR